MKSGYLDFDEIGVWEGRIKAKKARLEENSENGQNSETPELMCDSGNKANLQSNLNILESHQSVDESISVTERSLNPAKSTQNELVKPSQNPALESANEVIEVNANATNGAPMQNLGEKSGWLSSNEVVKAKNVEIGHKFEPSNMVNYFNKSRVEGDRRLVKIQQSVHATDGIYASSKIKARDPAEGRAKSTKVESICHLQDNNLKVTNKAGEIESTRSTDSLAAKVARFSQSGDWEMDVPKPSSRNVSLEDAPRRPPSAGLTFLGAVRALFKEACQVMENEHILDVAARQGYAFPRRRRSSPSQ